MLERKTRIEIQAGEWFFCGRKECFATTMTHDGKMVHVDEAGNLEKLDPDADVQQHSTLFDVADIVLEVPGELATALFAAKLKQQQIYGQNHVYLCVKADGHIEIEGNEHETYYRGKFKVTR